MTYLATAALVAVLALIFERVFGYPDRLFTRIKHPIVWMGGLIKLLDDQLNRDGFSGEARKMRGVIALAILLIITLAITVPLTLLLRSFTGGLIIEAIIASSMVAQKSLADYVGAVGRAFYDGLDPARRAVAHIVGRDPATLSESEVAKAAIESLAENTSDGVTAPLLWMLLFGLPGAAAYKAINTADSMIGYKNEKYQDFGWASARLDDFVNIPASRLTGYLFILVAMVKENLNWRGGLTAMKRDARNHVSPNAGWPESAMAGVLGIMLGGPRAYEGKVLDLATMGDGRRALERADIERALIVYRQFLTAIMVFTAGLAALFALIAWAL